MTHAVFPSIDFKSLRFEAPELLWLLLVPMGLLALWGLQLARRRADARRLRRRQKLPVGGRFQLFGGLLLWLGVILATASAIVAIARPYARVSLLRTAGVDLVILQDTSASMYVRDVTGNRWQRSMRFVRLLGEVLSWQEDRVALAVFAHVAAPQVRLTKDPNTFFFFLDHLETAPPFRLEDDPTWDTNIESGIHWGLRLIEKDEELHGPSPNARIFVLVSDGQAWSGDVKEVLTGARQRGFPMYVVGVGTTGAASSRNRGGQWSCRRRGRRSPRRHCLPSTRRSTGLPSMPSQPPAAGSISSSTASPTARSLRRSSTRRGSVQERAASRSAPIRSTGGFS